MVKLKIAGRYLTVLLEYNNQVTVQLEYVELDRHMLNLEYYITRQMLAASWGKAEAAMYTRQMLKHVGASLRKLTK